MNDTGLRRDRTRASVNHGSSKILGCRLVAAATFRLAPFLGGCAVASNSAEERAFFRSGDPRPLDTVERRLERLTMGSGSGVGVFFVRGARFGGAEGDDFCSRRVAVFFFEDEEGNSEADGCTFGRVLVDRIAGAADALGVGNAPGSPSASPSSTNSSSVCSSAWVLPDFNDLDLR